MVEHEKARNLGGIQKRSNNSLGEDPPALERRARHMLAKDPRNGDGLRLLGRALRALGRTDEADAVIGEAIVASSEEPIMIAAIRHLVDGRYGEAEGLIRRRLAEKPDDALAIAMMGDLASRLSIYDQAETYLRRALEIAPRFDDANLMLANVLHAQGQTGASLDVFEDLLRRNPENVAALKARISILGEIGEYERAIESHEILLELDQNQPGLLVGYANTLKTVGRSDDAIRAYRQALRLDHGCAEAWWALSNMKARQLDRNDIEKLEALSKNDLTDAQRTFVHFALGKAKEDQCDFEGSFHHYAIGNRIRLKLVPHDRDEITKLVDRAIEFFNQDFFQRHAGAGSVNPDPIFILGMPRAGSTLLEQILSSHSEIEGTSELPTIPAMVRRLLGNHWQDVGAKYPDLLADVTQVSIAGLGGDYLRIAATHRKTHRPFFIDKLPINWLHVGLIHLILPNATIIDARRDAMACCFANFKQHFARGQTFAYSLSDVGHQYRQYIRLMDHFDASLPGRVIRFQHEDLVNDPEPEVRRLLDRIGLPFEPACLRFHENARPVRTPSSEQVRRPINRDAIDLWKNYEPWLGELKQALGPLAPK